MIFDVPLIAQGSDETCWYAAARMIIEYYRQQKRQSTIRGGSIGMPEMNKRVFSNNQPINSASVAQFASTYGFSTRYICPSPAGLRSILNECGPLWYGGHWTGKNAGHVVVITGCAVKGITESTVYLNDPLPVGVGTKTYQEFSSLFHNLEQMIDVPFLYMR